MTRRVLLLISATTLLAEPTKTDITYLWNVFAAASREWAVAQEQVNQEPGISPVQSQKLWDEKVRPAFRAVDIAVRNQ